MATAPEALRARWRRWRWILLALLSTVLAALLLPSLPFVRAEALRRAERLASETLGREVRAASASLDLLQGHLELRGLTVAAGPRPADGPLLTAEGVRLRWSWPALLQRQLVIRELRLLAPRVVLGRAAEPPISPADAYALLLRIGGETPAGHRAETLRVERGSLAWADPASPWTAEGVAAQVEWEAAGAAAPTARITLRLDRLRAPLPAGLGGVERIHLSLAATSTELTVAAAEAETGGGRLTASGRIALSGETPQLSLALTGSAPLASLIALLGPMRRTEGTVSLEARLRGPWDRPSLEGVTTLTLGAGTAERTPLRLAVQGSREQVVFETAEPEPRGPFSGRLVFSPVTQRYEARLTAAGLDLSRLSGLPALLADLLGAQPPAGLGGRLTADLSVTGQGTELAELRGRGSLLVEELRLSPDLPAGRLETRLVATPSALILDTLLLRVSGAEVTGRGRLRFPDGRLEAPLQIALADVGAVGRGFGVPLLGGQASLTGHLTGTRDAPRFQGRLLWRDALIATTALDRIEGDIEVGPRALRFSRLALRIGQTAASIQGSLEASGTAPLRALDPKRDLRFDLTGQIAPGRTADLATLLPGSLPLQGPFRAAGRVAGTLLQPMGEVALTFGGIRVHGERWQQGSATLRLTPEAIEARPLTLRRGTEEVTGGLRIGRDGSLSGTLSSTPMDLARIGVLAGAELEGLARFRLTLDGSLRDATVTGSAEAEAPSYRGVRLGPTTAEFSAQTAGTEVRLVSQGGAYRAHLRLGAGEPREVEFDLTAIEADLLPLLRLADIDPAPVTVLRGSGRIRHRERGRGGAPGSGTGEFRTLHLRLGADAWEGRQPIALDWQGGEVALRRVRLGSGERELDIAGRIGADGAADLTAKGRLPLSSLAPWLGPIRPIAGLVTADLTAKGPLRSPELAGAATVSEGRFMLGTLAAPIQDATAALDFDGSRIRLRSFSGRCADGALTGEGEAVRGSEGWGLRLAFREEGARAEQLLASPSSGKGYATGRVTVTGSLQSDAVGERFWRNLDGAARFSMEGGRLGRNALLAQILALLNLRALVDTSGSDAPGEGMPYRRLSADVTVARGVARTENLILEAPAASASAVGRLDLVDETLDVDVAVRPFQNVDALLMKIPIAGWLLGGREKGLIIAYYKVTGTLDAPRMTARPLETLGRDVFGVFRRLLDIPEALLGPLPEGAAPPPIETPRESTR